MADWLKVTPSSGSGDTMLIVSYDENTSTEARTATIRITSAGGIVRTVTVTQDGAAASLSASPSSIAHGGSGESTVVTVTCNGSWTASTTADWLTLSQTSGTGNGTVTVTSSALASSEARNAVVTFTDGTNTVTVTVTQAAGEMTYGDVTIGSFSYSDIEAGGGTVTPAVTYSQTWGWNGSSTGGGTITSGATLSYSGTSVDSSTGAVNASSLGTTVKERTEVTTATVTVSLNGKTATAVADVYQAANVATYGDVSTSGSETSHTFDASGGTYTIKPEASQTITYTSGSTASGNVTSTATVKTACDGFSLSGLTVTATENTSMETRDGFVVTVTCTGEDGRTASYDVPFSQSGSVAYLKVDPESLSFGSDGGTETVSVSTNDSWTAEVS